MGENSLGRKYDSVAEAWIDELGRDGEKKPSWYSRARDYWEKKEASVTGMLDGYDAVSAVDLEASLCFLDKIKALPAYKGGSCQFNYALDCGAGIGRVTKGCLLHRFQQVDMVEPIEKFCRQAPEFVASERLKEIFQQPLQDFSPTKKYDCIWLQWCILYLTDADLVDLLKRCAGALEHGGVICVKENIGEIGFEIDKQDNSIMRTDKHYRQLFKQAGMRLLFDMRQPNFPRSLFPVNMYCLRPLEPKAETAEN
ncbi:Methyltransferase like 11A, related [Neospora caninum Liverpool]|uniref:Alpha N-terminal protein methyltransferase 1 n=1 Tax=Neospora caninum (strain Liverpool) TaxID=572307 RepID=F0VFL9_NEOCL|nr:Methyltransferase like 11A, related [Neospora caninum Liverpool]CBZ52513.1 Methyltransferase like 11A, related [Neospora caninum Liverpool]CEL66490.1 TPA: Methyltransferase like 11A, related [Neospora caninum Liverpool]|eukprot:XP_003882545.1 Methyltransferase like 11A, related [Neospora caninum Liverpool]